MRGVRGGGPLRLLALTDRRRLILVLGFAALLVLLGVSVLLAYRIQSGFSEEAARMYRAHLHQDEVLLRLRRVTWQSSILVRDLLLDRSAGRDRRFAETLAGYERDAAEQVARLNREPIPGQHLGRLNTRLSEFWDTVRAVPASTRALTDEQRYEFVQSQIAVRRLALSELLREVTELSHSSFTGGETRLTANRRTAGRRLVALLTLALVAGVLFAVISLRRLARLEAQALAHYEEVTGARSELRALSAQLMSLQETERAILSRELHDEIGQALATLRLELARLESAVRGDLPDIHARLSRSRAIVDSTVKAVRNISSMLRPSLLDDLGLAAALQWLGEDFTRRTGTLCTVREDNVSDELPIEVRTCVFRVAQEALHNVEKHAEARQVSVTVGQRMGELCLDIEDDGRGLAEADLTRWRTGSHLGILGMRERMAARQGTLAVGPGRRGGTRVEARLPLPDHQAAGAAGLATGLETV